MVHMDMFNPQKAPSDVAKSPMRTGKVFIPSETVNIEANVYSFQEVTNEKAAVAPIPGRASGNIIFHNTWNLLAPSTNAASSNSIGICLK